MGGGGVTIGEQHYMGPGTAEHTGWELPKGRHRRTDTRNQEHHTRRQEGNVELERTPAAPDHPVRSSPGRSLGRRKAGGRSLGPEPSSAAVPLQNHGLNHSASGPLRL